MREVWANLILLRDEYVKLGPTVFPTRRNEAGIEEWCLT